MAPTPKKKMTRGRSNRRRNANDKRLSIPNLVECSSCHGKKLPHKVCPHCGFYK